MFTQIFNGLNVLLGIALVSLSILLWSVFHRFSRGILAITGFLLYAFILLGILENYNLVSINQLLLYKGVPLLKHLLPFFMLISFIVSLILLFLEEKRAK